MTGRRSRSSKRTSKRFCSPENTGSRKAGSARKCCLPLSSLTLSERHCPSGDTSARTCTTTASWFDHHVASILQRQRRAESERQRIFSGGSAQGIKPGNRGLPRHTTASTALRAERISSDAIPPSHSQRVNLSFSQNCFRPIRIGGGNSPRWIKARTVFVLTPRYCAASRGLIFSSTARSGFCRIS
jgi:hypothetical protein